jgi:hypothetical protein
MSIFDQVSLSKLIRQDPHGSRHFGGFIPGATGISIQEKPWIQELVPFPQRSLHLGMADNGQPVLLDLFDPTQGPVLVAGDGDGGKTAFLQSLALGSDLQDPGEILFGVLTPFPEEWTGIEILSNCLGVWPAYHISSRRFLSQLVSWADVLPGTRQVVILIIDGLDLMMANGFQDQNDLRWLLTYGPRRHVWPLISVNPGRLLNPGSWLDYFQTRILGKVKRPQTAQLLVSPSRVDPGDFSQKGNYHLWQPGCWIKFKLPSISPEG